MTNHRFAWLVALGSVLVFSIASFSQVPTVEEQIVGAVAAYYLANPPVPELAGYGIANLPIPLRANPDCQECRILAWVQELEPTGFIVTSWDYRVEPLIAFSTEAEFPWEEEPENALRDVLVEDMIARTAAHDNGVAQGRDENLLKWRSIVLQSTRLDPFDLVGNSDRALAYASWALEPASTSEFQGPQPVIPHEKRFDDTCVYNDYCPCAAGCAGDCANVLAEQRYKPGCVARAMAQILYFHGYLAPTSFPPIIASYKSRSTLGTTAYDASCGLAYGELDALSDLSTWSSPDTPSQLCFAAAATLSARFGLYGTGASFEDAADALRNTWGYSRADLITSGFIDSSDFDRVEADVLCGRPSLLELRGYNTACHAVVCDGFKREYASMDGALLRLTSYYHLQMGRSTGGTTTWYNLTDPAAYPANYCVTKQAILGIATPISLPCVGDCTADLHVDRENGRYEQSDLPVITAQTGRPASTVLYDFNPAIYSIFTFLSPFTFATTDSLGTESKTLSLIPFRAQGVGIQTFVLLADMGQCSAMDVCQYAVGVDIALLHAAQIAFVSRGGATRIDFSVAADCIVNHVWVYLVTALQGAVAIPCPQANHGSVSVSQFVAGAEGDCLALVIANTNKGVLAAVCRD